MIREKEFYNFLFGNNLSETKSAHILLEKNTVCNISLTQLSMWSRQTFCKIKSTAWDKNDNYFTCHKCFSISMRCSRVKSLGQFFLSQSKKFQCLIYAAAVTICIRPDMLASYIPFLKTRCTVRDIAIHMSAFPTLHFKFRSHLFLQSTLSPESLMGPLYETSFL